MNPENLLDRLVENALGFLSESIGDFDGKLKYSVINFHSAVELFLKARLLAEHWSLVVSKRQEPDWNKFVAGDFTSVSLEEAAGKLEKVVRSGLRKQELETFRRLTKHRNRMVHFFHEATSTEENEELRRTIAKEQLTAWYLLHNTLTGKWSDVFSAWSPKLDETYQRLRRHHGFLQVVFDQLRETIRRRQENGVEFRDCPSCGFAAQEQGRVIGVLRKAECLVCGLAETRVWITCPGCDDTVLFVNEIFRECGNCGYDFEPEDLVEELIDDGVAHRAAMDGDDTWLRGNCSDCDGYHTVVRVDPDIEKFICASCFGLFDALEACGWCNELNTGDMVHSSWAGCNFCDGKSG